MTEQLTDRIRSVVRVEIEGVTASFRYPHFLIGRQPTFPMPPPSTIFGLVSAALGRYPDPTDISFAYYFTCQAKRVDDVETIWFTTPNTSTRGVSANFNIEATSNILPRELLIQPRLTLYLHGKDQEALYRAFRAPRYVPVLGRSQDLVSFRRVDRVDLEARREGRFDPSLMPRAFRERLVYGPTVNMPRFIDPDNRWNVDQEWYVLLDQPVRVGPGKRFEPAPEEWFWADPDTADPENGAERLLYFHSFVDEA